MRVREKTWYGVRKRFGASEEQDLARAKKTFVPAEEKKMMREGGKICCGRRKTFGASEEKDLVREVEAIIRAEEKKQFSK